MFRGLNHVSLDTKGRLAIPVRYREAISEAADGALVATVDRDRCLLLYPREAWESIERKLVELPSLRPDARALQRMLLGYATDLQMDGHGRILLPPPLREYAGLDHRVVMIGQGNKFELWSEDGWSQIESHWIDGGGLGDVGNDQLEHLSL